MEKCWGRIWNEEIKTYKMSATLTNNSNQLQPRKGRRRPPREFPGLYRRCLNVLSLFVILFSTLAPFRINLTLTLILINCAHPTDVYLNSAVLKLWIFTSPAGFWSMDKISRRMLDKICVMIGDLFVFYWFGRIWKMGYQRLVLSSTLPDRPSNGSRF